LYGFASHRLVAIGRWDFSWTGFEFCGLKIGYLATVHTSGDPSAFLLLSTPHVSINTMFIY
jgi:hypothetical protein